MDFRDFAANETSTLIARVSAGAAERSHEQLRNLRAALETALGSLESSITEPPQVDREITELVARLTKAAAAGAQDAARRVAEEGRKAADALRADLKLHAEQIESLSRALIEAQTQADALRADVEAERERGDGARAELADTRESFERADAARLEAVAACDAETSARESLELELRTLREEVERVETARLEAVVDRDVQSSARISAESELTVLRDVLESTRAELSTAATELEIAVADRARFEDHASVAQSQAEAAEAKLRAVTELLETNAARVKTLERLQKEHERTIRELEARRPAAATSGDASHPSLAVFDELLNSFEALGSSPTISDVLTTLVEHLAAEFPRVALFRVRGNRLEGEHQIGFDLSSDIGKVIVPLGMDSMLARAASSRKVERLSGRELQENGRTPFTGTPSCALALPIVVHDETLALVYADDSGQTERSPGTLELSTRFAGALQQHAVALLTRLTNELKTLAELRAYAGSLWEEIEQMYASDVDAGRTGEELQNRLKANVDYAHSIYANRAAFESKSAAALLDDQLVATLEKHNDTPFGRHLAAVTGRGHSERQQAAEAS